MVGIAHAQQGWNAGVQLGFNSVWIINQNNYGISEMDYKFKFGVMPGLAFGYQFSDHGGMQVELNYAFMGQDYSDRIRDFTPNNQKAAAGRQVDLHYLQIPVLYKFTSGGEKIRLHIMGGLQAGFLITADEAYQADISGDGNLTDIPFAAAPESHVPDFAATPAVEPASDYFNSLDLGIHLDFGADLYVNDHIFITPALKFYYGFTDINSTPTHVTNDYSASQNAFAGINVGVHYVRMKPEKKASS